jgi:hypothetical protein
VRARATLYPDALILSWIVPSVGGRAGITLALVNCTKVRSVPSPFHRDAIDGIGSRTARDQSAEEESPEGEGIADFCVHFNCCTAMGWRDWELTMRKNECDGSLHSGSFCKLLSSRFSLTSLSSGKHWILFLRLRLLGPYPQCLRSVPFPRLDLGRQRARRLHSTLLRRRWGHSPPSLRAAHHSDLRHPRPVRPPTCCYQAPLVHPTMRPYFHKMFLVVLVLHSVKTPHCVERRRLTILLWTSQAWFRERLVRMESTALVRME